MKNISKQFTKCQGYILSQIERAEQAVERPAIRYPAITISRETGAGAAALGEHLAEFLNRRQDEEECRWTVFDKNLIQRVLEDHDLPERLEKFMPEDISSPVKEAFGDMFGIHPPTWELLKLMNNTIYRLANMGNCIIIGRGANIVTRNLPRVLHLRLVGSQEGRVARYREYHGLGDTEARDAIKREDRARRRYLLAYFDQDIDDPLNYHAVINVDLFDPDALVRLIGGMIDTTRE